MLKANELRIGNAVLNPSNNQICFISSMDISDIENRYKERNPIPLTPEVLEKFGFNQWSEGNWKTRHELNINGWSEKFNYYQPYSILSTFCGSVLIKYLHQLQNLYFALTGTELEYKP